MKFSCNIQQKEKIKVMTKLCQKCSKRYFCKEVDTKEECNRFKSWIQTKNYGEIKHIKEKA